MGAANDGDSGLGEPEVADLAGVDEVSDGAGDVLDRHVRVDAVLVEQVDPVGPLQHLLDHLADVVGFAVEPPGRRELEPELRGDDDLVADRGEGLTDEGFVDERSVRLGGVEECHPQIVGGPDQPHAVVGVDGLAVVGAEAHAAQPDRRHRQAPCCQLSIVFLSSCAAAALMVVHGVVVASCRRVRADQRVSRTFRW
jgi:hypothetical protein